MTAPNTRLSPKMREALRLMWPGGTGLVHSGADVYGDGDVWVGFRTAQALQRRDLAVIDSTRCTPGEDYPDLLLTVEGARAAQKCAEAR
jgi:hypothetical protein